MKMGLKRQGSSPDYFIIKNASEALLPQILALGFSPHKYYHLDKVELAYRCKADESDMAFQVKLFKFILNNDGVFSDVVMDHRSGTSVEAEVRNLASKGQIEGRFTSRMRDESKESARIYNTALHILGSLVQGEIISFVQFFFSGYMIVRTKDDYDPAFLRQKMNNLIEKDLPVREFWIGQEEIASDEGIFRTTKFMPKPVDGKIRIIAIGNEREYIDVQPCKEIHVESTGQIPPVEYLRLNRENDRLFIEFDLKKLSEKPSNVVSIDSIRLPLKD